MGALEGLPEVEQKKALGSRIYDIIKEKVTARIGVFESGDATVEALANSFAVEIMEKNKMVVSQTQSYELINSYAISHLNTVETEANGCANNR